MAFVTRETRAINLTKLLCLYEILGHNQALEKNRKQAQISSFTPSALQERKQEISCAFSSAILGCVLLAEVDICHPPTVHTGRSITPGQLPAREQGGTTAEPTREGIAWQHCCSHKGQESICKIVAHSRRKSPSLEIFPPKERMERKEMQEEGLWC